MNQKPLTMRNHLPQSRPDYEDDLASTRQLSPKLAVTTGGGIRKKSAGVRQWLVLDSSGRTHVVEAGKHAIMRRTGLTAMDLRILDPMLSYPSTILGRERALVINLEHIKAIITAHEVLLLNSRDPFVVPFVEELKRRILYHYQATKAKEDDLDWKKLSDEIIEESKADGKLSLEHRDGSKFLPFEFVALEACLESTCSGLENEAETLEQEAHPALDRLTLMISPLNLERVRQIKSRLVAITGRVQKVRDELEHLLDDDEDMAEMYLTDKLIQQLETSTTSSINERDGDNIVDDDRTNEISFEATRRLDSYEVDQQIADRTGDNLFAARKVLRKDGHGTRTSSAHSTVSKHLYVKELEMLLEAYFVQVDGALNNLSTLREYVDDTEDYINIMLDDKQNNLLRMGVLLSTGTLSLSVFLTVVGVLGMNIVVDLFHQTPQSMNQFLWMLGGCIIGTILIYVAALAWYKHKHLLD